MARVSSEDRRAMAQTLCIALHLDIKYLREMAELPYGMLVEMMKNLNLRLLKNCEGNTIAEETYDYGNRIGRAHAAIDGLRKQ